ncbi:MAG: PHB depolymerase family esterase [Flavobacteriales bacterium]|nr:PHB depolymerase family esterase [Flavobacteriales bacterium]
MENDSGVKRIEYFSAALALKIQPMPRFLFAISLFLFSFCANAQDMPEIENFGKNQGKLRLFVHIPENLPEGNVPMVVVLHGCAQDAHGMMRLSGWNKLADEQGFIVAYPEQKGTNNANRCFNWFYGKDTELDQGEVASIHQAVEYMKSNYSVDESRVCITGVSAGAVMAVTAAALYPGDYSGVASYAGGPFGSGNIISGVGSMFGWVDRKPWEWARRVRLANGGYRGQYPKMIVLQGTDDIVCNPKNANEIVEQWTGLQEIDREAEKVEENFQDNQKVKRSSWADTSGTEWIVQYEFKGMGHALAVNVGAGEDQGGSDGLFSVDIGFHSTYWIAKEFGLIRP